MTRRDAYALNSGIWPAAVIAASAIVLVWARRVLSEPGGRLSE